jgi:tRNA dimethylallyltransferase
MSTNKEVLILCGPTAVGKTACSLTLAEALDGEIISADSMQLYRYMDIGSAKPTKEELSRIPHHLVDFLDPRVPFSVAEYQKMAREAIQQVLEEGKTPVVSGGTGLYVHSILYEMDFSVPARDLAFRQEMEELAEKEGKEAVHRLLMDQDQEAAERIHPNSLKRVIRSLEILREGGKLRGFEESFIKNPNLHCRLIGLTRDREELYRRINERVDLLMEAGLLEEVRSLMDMGLTEQDISMKGIGYKEIIAFLKGEYALEEAVALIKQNTRNYAKRQLTWFRRYGDIKWFDLSLYPTEKEAGEEILQWLRSNK